MRCAAEERGSEPALATARRAALVAFVTTGVVLFGLVEVLFRLGPHPDIRGLVFGFAYAQHLIVERYSPVSDLRSLVLILFVGYLLAGCLLGGMAGVVPIARPRPWTSAAVTWVFVEVTLCFVALYMANAGLISVE